MPKKQFLFLALFLLAISCFFLMDDISDKAGIQGLMCSSVIGEEPGLIAAYSFDRQRLGVLYDKKGTSNGKYISLIPESIVKSDAPIKANCIKKNEGQERSIISGTEPPEDFHVWFEGPSSIGLKWGNVEDVDSYLIYRSEFKNILNKHNVTACWQGHWHGFNRFVLDGARGIVSGGGGGDFHEPIITKKV